MTTVIMAGAVVVASAVVATASVVISLAIVASVIVASIAIISALCGRQAGIPVVRAIRVSYSISAPGPMTPAAIVTAIVVSPTRW